MKIRLNKLNVDFDDRFQLNDIDWGIDHGQNWMIVGANGSGKSALAAVLSGQGQITSGSISGLPVRVAVVSAETQAALLAQELEKDDADILDIISEGTPAAEILDRDCSDDSVKQELIDKLGFRPLMDRAFRTLSSGETRKLMLIRALASEAELLVLDEPFSGLDAESTCILQRHLDNIAGRVPMVLILNRLDQCPGFITHIAHVQNGRLEHLIDCKDIEARADLYKLLHLETTELEIPASDFSYSIPQLDPSQPLVRLSNVAISYADLEIFSSLNWTIEASQHWQLSGPNGCGKTSLLALITGDHPQCYSNDIFVFGFQRGNGESIWQIKQFIGFVSSALQWEYRVSISVRNVIISGFYDSIGLYQKSTPKQQAIADQWLELLGMSELANQPFNELSFGYQRLLLIARAMVKKPPLLILDEPCLGLDEMNRQLVLALIEKICASNTSSVVYVSHHAEDQIKGIEHSMVLGETNIAS